MPRLYVWGVFTVVDQHKNEKTLAALQLDSPMTTTIISFALQVTTMDDLSQDLLVALKKPSATLDSKLNLFTSVKSHIKHQRIPESAQATTIECIRLAIASQTTPALVTTGFSALGHLIKRLTLQDQAHAVFNPRTQIIPTLLDRLGDPKESYRAAALQSLCDLYPARPMDVEKAVKEGAIQGSNARAKEGGMQWVTTVRGFSEHSSGSMTDEFSWQMHSERSLQFKAFVPLFIECLSHADGGVRDTAKNNLVVLFRYDLIPYLRSCLTKLTSGRQVTPQTARKPT